MARLAELRILFVEDFPEDVEIASRELRKAGMVFESARVETEGDFLAALSGFNPDVIISDYSMPHFDGMRALRFALDYDSTIPVIILTGSMNEETAVLCLKSGASDYVIKGHIGRLSFAILEALEHSRITEAKERSARALRESEQSYRTLADSGQALIWTSGLDMGCGYFNKPWLAFTGRSLEEEIGNGWTAGVHPEDLERCVDAYAQAFAQREKFSVEYRLRRYDGVYRWVQDDGSPRYGAGGEFLGYIGHCLDITGRKLTEESLRQALSEKEALLRELFHRTRNNMQVIIALLAFEEDSLKDELVTRVVRKTSDRIMSMSLVHKKLYESHDLSMIDLKSYAEDLLELLKDEESFPRGRVEVRLSAEPVLVHIDTAVPCGLILHELASNAFRHAFPGDARGELRIGISKTAEGLIELEVADDGIGLPEGFDYKRKDTLGFQLVRGLVEEQLGGVMSFEVSHGLTCRASFKDIQSTKRF